MIEAGAPSTEDAFGSARPTGDSHGLTARGPAQRFEGAKRRAAQRNKEGSKKPRGLRRYSTSCPRPAHLPYGHILEGFALPR
jgi:hypothetical protein